MSSSSVRDGLKTSGGEQLSQCLLSTGRHMGECAYTQSRKDRDRREEGGGGEGLAKPSHGTEKGLQQFRTRFTIYISM